MISLMDQRVTLTAGWHAACKTIMSGCRDQASGIFQLRDDDDIDLGNIKKDAKNGQIEENSSEKANRICS